MSFMKKRVALNFITVFKALAALRREKNGKFFVTKLENDFNYYKEDEN